MELRWTLCLLLLSACTHATVVPPPVAPRAKLATSTPSTTTEPPGRIEDYMLNHYVIAVLSRDAVIGGSLEGMRAPLRSFAEHKYADVALGGWLPYVAQLQEAARLTASAATLDLAATGVATMARGCGACHTASGRGPAVALRVANSHLQRTNMIHARMGMHMWAAEQLWEGLVVPSDEAWNQGAAALAHLPAEAPAHEPPLSPAFAQALLEVRTLGENALEAASQDDRANVYARLLARCAACHAQQVAVEL